STDPRAAARDRRPAPAGTSPPRPAGPPRPAVRPGGPPCPRSCPHWYQPPPSISPCRHMGYSGQTSDLSGTGGAGLAVTDEAIEKIKAMITSGVLRAGDRLPREADLAAELGLSRSSLREAVRALSLVNILDVRRGDGTYVTSLEPQLLLEALSFIV